MNWITLLAELSDAGLTQTEIATECGVSQSTISDISRDRIKSPNYELGTKLVALHMRKVPAKAGEHDATAAVGQG